MQKTFRYIIFSLLFVFGCTQVNGQIKALQKDTVKVRFFNGIRLDVDLVPLASSFLSTHETYSYEVALQSDLKHKYFPVVEIGYGGADKISSTNIGYKTDAVFGRVGLDFNIMKEKKSVKPTNNLFLAGIRVGFSSFKYNITDVSIVNDYWGENQTLNYENIPATRVWIEFVAGMRVEIFKNVFLGWTVKNKSTSSEDVAGKFKPWYIPGFGLNTGNANWEVNYCLGYKF